MDKAYIVIVQCDIVKQRCSGYKCEKAFHQRTGGFQDYPPDKAYRTLYMTCGGCCGRAVQRKLSHLLRLLRKSEKIEKDQVVVHLSTCIAKESYHGPVCPHLDYLKALIARLGVETREGTTISPKAEERRKTGQYQL